MDVYYNNELLNSKDSCDISFDFNNGYVYIKCSNGLTIITGRFSIDTNGRIGTYEKDIEFPFKFDNMPAVSLSATDHNCTVYTSSYGISGFTASLNLKKASSTSNVIVNFFAIGKRK